MMPDDAPRSHWQQQNADRYADIANSHRREIDRISGLATTAAEQRYVDLYCEAEKHSRELSRIFYSISALCLEFEEQHGSGLQRDD